MPAPRLRARFGTMAPSATRTASSSSTGSRALLLGTNPSKYARLAPAAFLDGISLKPLPPIGIGLPMTSNFPNPSPCNTSHHEIQHLLIPVLHRIVQHHLGVERPRPSRRLDSQRAGVRRTDRHLFHNVRRPHHRVRF